MKFLGGAALISILVVAVIVLLGQQKATETLLKQHEPAPLFRQGTTAKQSKKSAGTGENVIGRTLDSTATQEIATLLQSARLNYVSAGGQISTAAIMQGFHSDAPGVKVSKSVRSGWILLRRPSAGRLTLCTQSGGPWHCFSESLETGITHDAYAARLKPALRKSAG